MTEEGYTERGVALWSHGAEGRHLEDAADRSNFRLAHLRHTVKHELDRLLIEWSDRERSSSDPAVLVGDRELFRQSLLDADNDLVERCREHGSEVGYCNVVSWPEGVNGTRS